MAAREEEVVGVAAALARVPPEPLQRERRGGSGRFMTGRSIV
jgi:hypothetical protein